MGLKRTPRGALVGLAAGLLVLMVLNLLAPTGGVVVAQDQPTPTPEPTSTPLPPTATSLPSFQLQATYALLPEGDLNADGIPNPGDTVVYTIRVISSGGAPAGPTELVFLFDSNFISGVAAITGGGIAGEGQVLWNLPQMEVGQQIEVSFTATLRGIFPPGRTQVAGTALVRSGGIELGRTTTPIIEVIGPDLRLVDVTSELVTDVAQNGRIDPGDTVRFVLSYANSGGGASQEAWLVADYPDELTREITSNPNNAQDTDGTLVWLIGSVPAGGTVNVVQFTVTFQETFPPGVVTYELRASLRSRAGVLDERALAVPVFGPSLVVTPTIEFLVDASGDGLADAGDQIRVTIQYANVGTDTASNVVLSAAYDPAYLEVSGVQPEGVQDTQQGTISWNFPALEAGSTGQVAFQARVLTLPAGLANVRIAINIASDQTLSTSQEAQIGVTAPTPTPEATPATPLVSETRVAQGQGILSSFSIALLVGAFLLLSLLAIVYVASRVLPATPEEREALDTEEERTANRQLVRELLEGVVLTAILFSVMVLGLQNALDRNSINSIIAGIVGYVAGRVTSGGTR
jgi:hypothetical protein